MPILEDPQNLMTRPSDTAAKRLRLARVLLVGLGNIGSQLAALLSPHVAFIRLVDRDFVELRNAVNQFYGPQHVGQSKVAVTAERLQQQWPQLGVERRVSDLEDLPWEDFADVDIAVAGLDSLLARQFLAERLYTLQIPYVDGAVGDPMLARIQVLLPGKACLECSWGKAQYRQLTTEYPCRPGGSAEAASTTAPSCAGAATASLMVAQCMTLFADNPPPHSYEINGDLMAGRFVSTWRCRSERCRFHHQAAPRLIRLKTTFNEATIADVVTGASAEFESESIQFEFRRGLLDGDLFGSGRFASPAQLRHVAHCRLAELGLTPRDRVVVRASLQPHTVHLCFQSTRGG